MNNLIIHTDGAYSSSRNQGGVGIVFVKDDNIIFQYSRTFKNTTNNRCELSAVIIALNAISKPFDSITIYSDSQYVINSINLGWQRKKNIQLWEYFDKIYKQAKTYCKDIKFVWEKGHNDSKFNIIADDLAVNASHGN